MESSKHTMHPSLVLVNDEILSTQVRLTELYVKQAEALAANEAARAQERFQAELTALQEELKQKETALETQHALFHQTDQDLRAEVQELRARLLASQCSLQVRQTELDFARSDAQVLQQRIAQAESTIQKAYASIEIEVARARATWQEELSALERQLERKESAHQLLQTSVKEIEGKLRAEIQDLRSQLATRTELLKDRTEELQNAQRETALLRRHMQQFALTGAQTEATASEAIKTRDALQAELASLRTALEQKDSTLKQTQAATTELEQRFNLQLRDLQSQLSDKQGLLETRIEESDELSFRINDLQQQIVRLELAKKQAVEEASSAARAIQDGLRARLQELEAIVSEKAQLLQNRSAELESAQTETARLRERIQNLEWSGAQTQAAHNEAEKTREALQHRLAEVQSALEDKDASIAQREAQFKESSERLHAQLNDLNNQLAEKRQALDAREHELLNTRSEIATLTDRMQELERAKTADEKNASLEMERLRERHETELVGLRADLAQRQSALEQEQNDARLSGDKLNHELQRLEAQLTEKDALFHRADLELQQHQSKIAGLREELARSEFAHRQTEMLAATQAEQIREQVKAEIGALDAQLREKESALKRLANHGQELESSIDDLQRLLAEKEPLLESRDIEVRELRAQAGELRARVTHLEQRQGETLEQQRAAAGQLEKTLRIQVSELQNQLAEQLALLDARNHEVQALESKVTELFERIDRSAAALEQARATAAGEIEQIRRQSQAELIDREAEIERKAEALQKHEAALQAAEQNLQTEMNALRAEVAEKRSLLENRNDELLRVKREADSLQDRIAYLESAARQTDLESPHGGERAEEQTTPEVDRLWEELGQKEQMLEQRQTAVNDLEQGFQAQIDRLRSELAEKQALLENPGTAFLLGEPTLTETQKEKLSRLEQLVETIKADNEQTLISPHNRKWRFSLSRKRRWKF